MSFQWQTAPDFMMTALMDTFEQRVQAAVVQVCQRRAPEIENWMKANAPWTDLTGNARQTLFAETLATVGQVVVLLAHGMDYGIYLERSNAGRYAIIAPAVDHWAPILMQDIQELLR